MPRPITILVTGATGQQGGALARQLLERGHRVRVLTRRPGSPAARALEAHGAELHAGAFDDARQLDQALRGCDGLFAMSTFREHGVDGEVAEGKALVDAAARSGVGHVVYTSVVAADRHTGIPHFDSKGDVERHLARSGPTWTVIAPCFFMENFTTLYAAGLREGRIAAPLPRERKLYLVAVDDIATTARLAFERRTEFAQRRLEIAGDALTLPDVASILSAASRRTIVYQRQSLEEVRAVSEDLARMWEWFERGGHSVDLEALRRTHAEVGWRTLREWSRRQDWGALLGTSPAAGTLAEPDR